MLFLKPKTLAIFESKYNGKIKVIQQLGGIKIVASDLLQSGSIIKDLWQKPLHKFKNKNLKIKDVLLFGLGGGTLIPMLGKTYPDCNITAIEIDPIMIKIAHDFFKIEENNNLKIINDDAFSFIKNYQEKFDLILIDIYKGNQIPEGLNKKSFYQNLKKITNPQSFLICNCLFFDQYRKKTEEIVQYFAKYFTNIQLLRHLSNLFIIINLNK